MTRLLYPHGEVPDIQWSEEWLGPRADLGTMEKKKNSLSLAQPLNRPRRPHIFLLGLRKKNNLRHSGTNPEDQVACVPKFYMVAPHSFGSSDHITLLARAILECLLGLLYNMCTPTLCNIPYWPLFTETQRTFPYATAWVFLWPFLAIYDRSNCAYHPDTSLRLYAPSSRAEIAAVTSVSKCPTNQNATLPRFNAGCAKRNWSSHGGDFT
jgi:hypothetical protein